MGCKFSPLENAMVFAFRLAVEVWIAQVLAFRSFFRNWCGTSEEVRQIVRQNVDRFQFHNLCNRSTFNIGRSDLGFRDADFHLCMFFVSVQCSAISTRTTIIVRDQNWIGSFDSNNLQKSNVICLDFFREDGSIFIFFHLKTTSTCFMLF